LSPLALSLRFLQTQSDAQLATLARAGHERAFEALVRRYRRPLLAYCRRFGGAGVNPEDTLQQALLQAWTAIRTGVEVRDPRAWLYRIVHNVAVSNQRRPALVPVELEDTAGANGADHEAEQRMAARAALAGLAALPHLQREVMVGTAVDGLSHDELASALGLSSGAVRGLIYRARATLRAAAAAVLPAPVINWALRSGSGRASGVYEALGGGGSAGLGGILLKGGVIAATAGAIATAGISTSQPGAHHRSTRSSEAGVQHAVRQQSPTSAPAASTVLVTDPARASSPAVGERSRPGSDSSGSGDQSDRGADRSSDRFVTKRGSDDRRGSAGSAGGEHHEGSAAGSGDSPGGPGPSGGSKSGSGNSGPGGGSDGGHGDGATSGSGGHSGDLSGSDGGSGGSGSSSSGSGSSGSGSSGSGISSGSGSSGSDGGSSATADPAPETIATVDDGSDGSGHDGGSTTTTTTTTDPATTDDHGGSGHQHGK
jgi:RNA polymerase sigma factor (sigma-70 family)